MSRTPAWLVAAAAAGVVSAAACAGPKLPSRWIVGGGRLDLASARWSYAGDPVEIRPRGFDYAEVLIDDDVELHIDRVGRVYDRYKRPVAVLESDGRLVGLDNELLGTVGSQHAALPGRANAWLSLTDQGVVVKYDDGGYARPEGQWLGCAGSAFAAQACLLVSYVLFFDDEGVRTGEQVPVTSVGPSLVGPAYGP
jgi:hypothetical protein